MLYKRQKGNKINKIYIKFNDIYIYFLSFIVSFNHLKVYTNAERTRTFLALKVDELYFKKMLNILQKIDQVMKDFKLATFYEVNK